MAAKKEVKAKEVKKEEAKSTTKNKTVEELRNDLQETYLKVKTGIEKNTSLIRKLKKQIARELTKSKNTK